MTFGPDSTKLVPDVCVCCLVMNPMFYTLTFQLFSIMLLVVFIMEKKESGERMNIWLLSYGAVCSESLGLKKKCELHNQNPEVQYKVCRETTLTLGSCCDFPKLNCFIDLSSKICCDELRDE